MCINVYKPSGRVSYRRWSCYCSATQMCSCIKPQTVYVGHIDKSSFSLQLPSLEKHMSICSHVKETDVSIESSTAPSFNEYCTGTVMNIADVQYIVLHDNDIINYLPAHLITEVYNDTSQAVIDGAVSSQAVIEAVSGDAAQHVADGAGLFTATAVCTANSQKDHCVSVSSFYSKSSGIFKFSTHVTYYQL